MIRLILLAVLVLAFCIGLLCVRIIFGRKKEFLRGHACAHSAGKNGSSERKNVKPEENS